MTIKTLIKAAFRASGLQIDKISATSCAALQTAKALKTHKVNVVFDVGANTGQFARDLRNFGYTGKIISFEPLPMAFASLRKQAAKDVNWVVHPRCAVGAENSDIEINVAGNSVSSSILPMLSAHENAAPQSRYTHQERVPLITLDSVYAQYCKPGDNIFLKIDTQGYEWQVMDGAGQLLRLCVGVLLELSLVPLYHGQRLWHDCVTRMDDAGLDVFGLQPGFTDPRSGQTLQMDGLFFR